MTNYVAKNIKYLRTYYNMSQLDVAERIGASDKAISAWELGTREPKMGYIQKIADLFNIPTDNFINDDMSTYNTLPTKETLTLDAQLIQAISQLSIEKKEALLSLIKSEQQK